MSLYWEIFWWFDKPYPPYSHYCFLAFFRLKSKVQLCHWKRFIQGLVIRRNCTCITSICIQSFRLKHSPSSLWTLSLPVVGRVYENLYCTIQRLSSMSAMLQYSVSALQITHTCTFNLVLSRKYLCSVCF